MAHAFLNAARPDLVPLHCSKQAFARRKEAARARNNMDLTRSGLIAMGVGRTHVYHCPLCLLWHVGHEPVRKGSKG